jgi:ribosomal protein L32
VTKERKEPRGESEQRSPPRAKKARVEEPEDDGPTEWVAEVAEEWAGFENSYLDSNAPGTTHCPVCGKKVFQKRMCQVYQLGGNSRSRHHVCRKCLPSVQSQVYYEQMEGFVEGVLAPLKKVRNWAHEEQMHKKLREVYLAIDKQLENAAEQGYQ